MKNWYLCCIYLLGCWSTYGQQLSGKVLDGKGAPLFAVNVYCINDLSNGTVTDFAGIFELSISDGSCDSLVFSYLGYQSAQVSIDEIKVPDFTITLQAVSTLMAGVEIKASPNVTQEFSLMEMSKLDIYLNPSAAADPLKAITTLPYSTNDDETANPALRGSTPERSKVFLNGVPIERPVRNSQLNGVGFFSLFNTALLEKQVVYASNPPLNFGNASAGIVELETETRSSFDELRLTAGMANLGLQGTKNLNDKGIFQVYGNWQLASPFLALNQSSLPNLLDFRSGDIGINAAYEINEKSSLRLYSYGVDESAAVNLNLFAYQDTSQTASKRHFHILNYKTQLKKGWWSLALGYDKRNSNFSFGNIQSIENERQWYGAFNWKHYFSDEWILQAGTTFLSNQFNAQIDRPVYYFANAPASPTVNEHYSRSAWSPELYAYLRFPVMEHISGGIGYRQALPFDGVLEFSSYQANLLYEKGGHRLLLAGGAYYNLANPNFFSPQFQLLSSRQYTAEYTFELEQNTIQAAAFHKVEEEAAFPNRKINGLEFYWERHMGDFWRFTLANTYLDINYTEGEFSYQAENDYAYFLKFSLNYDNSKLVNVGLTGIFRPGRNFTPIRGGTWISAANAFEPIFATEYNGAQLSPYQAVNLSINKVFDWDKTSLIIFTNISNVFDWQNEADRNYASDYQSSEPIFFPGMVFYAGFVLGIVR